MNTDKIYCPMYLSQPGRTIKCKGIIPDTFTKILFCGDNEESEQAKEAHYNGFCCNADNFPRCPIYASIMQFGGDE